MHFKSINGNILYRISGRYSDYFIWVIGDSKIKITNESEYAYLYDRCSMDNFIDMDPPKIAVDYINEIESHIGDFIPYNKNMMFYHIILKQIFGDSFNKSSLMKLEDCTFGYDDSVDLDNASKESALLNWYGGYREPSVCLDSLTDKFQFVFANNSSYYNDYIGRIRNIYCGLNYIDFESRGSYGSVNGLDFELKIYKRK